MVGRGLLAPSAYIFTLSLVPSPAATTAGFFRTPGEEYTCPWDCVCPMWFCTTGQWRNRKNSTGNRASSRSARLHDRVQNRRDSSAAPGFERIFCLLTGVCCYRCAHEKGVLLASRSLFSQRRQAWGRAIGHRGNGRSRHGKKTLLEKSYANEDANPPTWVMPRSWLSLR